MTSSCTAMRGRDDGLAFESLWPSAIEPWAKRMRTTERTVLSIDQLVAGRGEKYAVNI